MAGPAAAVESGGRGHEGGLAAPGRAEAEGERGGAAAVGPLVREDGHLPAGLGGGRAAPVRKR